MGFEGGLGPFMRSFAESCNAAFFGLSRKLEAKALDERSTAVWPPSPRHRSATLPWRLTMLLTVHSFRTSDGVIATEEA